MLREAGGESERLSGIVDLSMRSALLEGLWVFTPVAAVARTATSAPRNAPGRRAARFNDASPQGQCYHFRRITRSVARKDPDSRRTKYTPGATARPSRSRPSQWE